MYNVQTHERKTMEQILSDDYRGRTNAQELEESLRASGWRQDRDPTKPITQSQIRRGLRNNSAISS